MFFPGNYQEYEADKKKCLGEEGAKPKRIRFQPLKWRASGSPFKRKQARRACLLFIPRNSLRQNR